MNKLILLTVALTGVLFWLSSGPDIDWPVTNAPPREGLIVAFGDSLTRGKGAEPGRTYPEQLAGMLGLPIENLGVNGQTTRGGLDALKALVKKTPAVVIITLGGNDIIRKHPRESTFSNLEQIFRLLTGCGAMVVYAAIEPPFVSDKWVKGIRDICRNHGVLYVPDVMDGMWLDQDLMSDAIHPNSKGYELLARRVAIRLQPLLQS